MITITNAASMHRRTDHYGLEPFILGYAPALAQFEYLQPLKIAWSSVEGMLHNFPNRFAGGRVYGFLEVVFLSKELLASKELVSENPFASQDVVWSVRSLDRGALGYVKHMHLPSRVNAQTFDTSSVRLGVDCTFRDN